MVEPRRLAVILAVPVLLLLALGLFMRQPLLTSGPPFPAGAEPARLDYKRMALVVDGAHAAVLSLARD